jgi:hypothetical protein
MTQFLDEGLSAKVFWDHAPSSPIFLRFALDRWVLWVLAFDPVPWAAGAVGRAKALRHDAFEAELAGMGEDSQAVALDVVIEPDAGTGAATGPKLER